MRSKYAIYLIAFNVQSLYTVGPYSQCFFYVIENIDKTLDIH